MKAALISLGSKSSKMTSEAMKKYFEQVDDLDIRNIEVNLGAKLDVLSEGVPLGDYDCILAKGSFRYAPLLRSITRALDGKTYMPVSSGAFTLGHDKLLTQLALQMHKIPTPKTYLSSSTKAAKKILEKINYPIIMKFPSGTGGKGVMYADSYAAASSMLDALESLKQPFLIQEYVETGGTDIRAIVVGDKVVASMVRKADKGEARANIHAGGQGEAIELDYHTKKIAVTAAKSIGAEICGVDILEGSKGPVVIEINLSPGLQGITKTTKVDIADKMAKYLFKKAKQRLDSGKEQNASKLFSEMGIKAPESAAQHIVGNLDFRSNRILLPEVITNIAKLSDKDEVEIKANKGKISIEKFNIG